MSASEFLLQFGVMLFPLSVVIMIFASDKTKGLVFWSFMFVTTIFIYLGYWSLRKAAKMGAVEAHLKILDRQQNDKRFKELMEEIRRLRGDRNEKSRTDHFNSVL